MADPFDSPVDVVADERGLSGLGQMAIVIIIAVITLALFNARALAAWADALEPGARSARIGEVAHALADHAAARGFDGPRATLHDQWNLAKAAQWPEQPGPDQTRPE